MKNRDKMLDSMGKPMTQSLFVELGYQDCAVYTLKEVDHEWNGKKYPSIRRLYLEKEDPTEYEFANEYFMGWRHWLRICENKQIRVHIDEWRDELEYKMRAKAVKLMVGAAQGGNYQAVKWLADRGWATRAAGRPSKAEVEHEKKVQAGLADEFSADVHRLFAKTGTK